MTLFMYSILDSLCVLVAQSTDLDKCKIYKSIIFSRISGMWLLVLGNVFYPDKWIISLGQLSWNSEISVLVTQIQKLYGGVTKTW